MAKPTFDRCMRGEQGHFFSKNMTPEAAGLLLPFLLIPGELQGQCITLEVDNVRVVISWKKQMARKV
jgi:hypothetical protein